MKSRMLNLNVVFSVALGVVIGYLLLLCSSVTNFGEYLAELVILNKWFLLNLYSVLEEPEAVMSVLKWIKSSLEALPLSLFFGCVCSWGLKNRINVRFFIYSCLIPLLVVYVYLSPSLLNIIGFGLTEQIIQSKIRYEIFSNYAPLFVEFIVFYLVANKWKNKQKNYNQ